MNDHPCLSLQKSLRMTSSIKSLLPTATFLCKGIARLPFKGLAIVASPMLLAATSPPANTVQMSCGLSHPSGREVVSSTSLAASEGHVVHPVASSTQAVVTSAQEWIAIWLNAAQDSLGQNAAAETMPDSLAFVENAVSTASAQRQSRCTGGESSLKNSKEEPSDIPTLPSSVPTGDLPNLDPAVLPPVSPAPVPASPAPNAPAALPPLVLPPSAPSSSAPSPSAAPSASGPTIFAPIPTRPTSPPPIDPTVDPTNVTPTSEPATPFDGVVTPTLAALPDGAYRYLSGNYEYGIYSDQQLAANGGAVVLLTKRGDRVVGNFYPRFGQSGICISGRLSEDTVVGPAYTIDAVTVDTNGESISQNKVTEVGESYEPYAGVATFQVRQPRIVRVDATASQAAGEDLQQTVRIVYAESLLDLSEYSRINAGSALAPSDCDVPVATTERVIDLGAAE